MLYSFNFKFNNLKKDQMKEAFIIIGCNYGIATFINFKKTAFVASQKKCCKAAHIFKRDPKFKLNFKKL